MRILYLIGLPGSDKSTALNAALRLAGWGVPSTVEKPVPHLNYGRGRIQLGRLRETFPGTDALGMAINPRAIDFVRSSPATILVAEGDRLANEVFLDACARAAVLTVALIDTPLEVARERARARAAAAGRPPQDDRWWKGRATKTANLRSRWNPTEIDGRLAPEEVAASLAALLAEISPRS